MRLSNKSFTQVDISSSALNVKLGDDENRYTRIVEVNKAAKINYIKCFDGVTENMWDMAFLM